MTNDSAHIGKGALLKGDGYIVGIGASAGGLEALQRLLNALSPNTGFPYIIIQHLAPDYKSLLSEILGKHTKMPVVQAEEGVSIQPNHVYVIPPSKNMVLSNGKLRLSNQKEGELNLPIDIFFNSLAEQAGSRAIAVILSGTGSDGTNGVKSVKENNGMILVQNPDSAKFDGMPKSAMRTGLVDALLTPEEMALELKHIGEAADKGSIPPSAENQIDVDLMKRIYVIMKKVSNVNFTHYKQSTILRRIERRMVLAHKESLEEYVDFLYEVPEEARLLSKEVLIGVTNFFREPEYFETLKDKAVTRIVLESTADEPIRVWVAGCSTGEEAYSIAILFSEVIESLKLKREVRIFATDLDTEAVTIAGKGAYGDSIANSVSPARLSKYFTRKGNSYVINRDIRKMIVFSPHNVFQDPPFGRLDLISCRNMLIYFQPVLQNDLFAIFHAALKNGGFLFLGKSEAVGAYTEAFPVVDAAAKIFTHRSEIRIGGARAVPYLKGAFAEIDYDGMDEAAASRWATRDKDAASQQTDADTTLLERFMPACLIVNEANELVHTYGENGNYIHFPVGKISTGLFDVITDSLKIPVSTLLKEAREKKQTVQYKDIHFVGERAPGVIHITAMPFTRKTQGMENNCALVFVESNGRGAINEAVSYDVDSMASQRITDLEQELSELQDRLGKSVAEQECVNEELQAANEELLTANEELQSSNEELQSVNEELYTVNSEYQVKLAELADMNDDITNFLASTLVGIIFVDSKLSVRRFTNYVVTEFNVMDQDIGRPINFISYHFTNIDIAQVCINVLRTLVPVEREAITSRDKTFFLRVAPYRTSENKILGCVITFVDVTMQKQGQVMLRSTEKLLTMAQQASEAKSDFLSRMSHEIRTPMNALKGLAELAQRQLDDKPALLKSLKHISETVNYMTSIVSDILEMSSIEHSELILAAKPFSLRVMLNRVVSMIAPRMKDSNLTFNTELAENFAPAYVGDETRLQQVLINFLTNAQKYTPDGGTVVFKAYEEAKVGDQVTLCFIIADTGIGISEAFMPDLFKPFSKEKPDESDSKTSMGLGLSIAYNLIKLMHGDVKVESKVNEGSTFTVRIPINSIDRLNAMPEAPAPTGEAELFKLSDCHVMIAEDNDMNRGILEMLMTQRNITYTSVSDGEGALNAFIDAPAFTFDCILMDMRMPNLDGIGAAMRIRELDRPDARSVPIIAVSANAFTDDIQKAKLSGMNDYVTKPIDTGKLFSAMEKLVITNRKQKH